MKSLLIVLIISTIVSAYVAPAVIICPPSSTSNLYPPKCTFAPDIGENIQLQAFPVNGSNQACVMINGNGNATFTYSGQISCDVAVQNAPVYYDIAYVHPAIANLYSSPYNVPVTGGTQFYHLLAGNTYNIQLGRPITWMDKSGTIFGGYPFINTWQIENNYVVTGSFVIYFGDLF